jgi:peroxiredoxin Q/BCP
MLKTGDQAPDFSLQNQDGQTISRSVFQGQKLIIFFYPKADTPGCTAEACSLRDAHAALKEQGFAMVGVSPDKPAKLKKFQEKYSFPYDLLADPEQSMLRAYGVWGPKKFMGKEYEGVLRTTFLLDETGKITHIIEKVNTKEHASQILDLL